MTKFEEIHLFQKFQENYKNMPLGKVLYDDKPDVTFTTSNGEIIGIELTECIYDEILMKESEYQIKFNEKVIEKLEPKISFKFYLDIILDTKNPLRQNQIESTINDIIEVCIEEFGDLNQYESKCLAQLDVDWNKAPLHIQQQFLERGYRKLPKSVLSIQMSRFDILEKSRHSESKGGVIPDFTDYNLSSILLKKDKALKNYKICDQYWLLIGEGADFYSYINQVRIKKKFETKFDKVFIYRRWHSEVIVIK
ncbi:hypothetical protein [Algoriphagus litoralis]|uniref:hypothetical protein n=1 Tax=Algoriphagus litoralis TaxID=2202829 RepID=UPI000DB97C98|nr:hypothetical protein [Algoriphagus litoralis]